MTRKFFLYGNCKACFGRIYGLSAVLLAFFLLSCSSRKSETANTEKLLLSLKDTVYARAVEPEDGAAHLQELLRLYPDRTGWE
ncbi:MAG: hypothetical protein LBJ47_06695, partial [Tannerella sp.]|nr:hypothetical protein [Tannerella sp.]